MNITILSLGHKMPDWIRTGYEEYLKRLKNSHNINLIELNKPEDMLKKIDAKHYIIGLDEKGKNLNTQAFAEQLNKIQINIQKNLTFLIGGADGLLPECKSKANELWSLSSLTFPHMLVRIILIEQLYRAFSLLQNHPYHRE